MGAAKRQVRVQWYVQLRHPSPGPSATLSRWERALNSNHIFPRGTIVASDWSGEVQIQEKGFGICERTLCRDATGTWDCSGKRLSKKTVVVALRPRGSRQKDFGRRHRLQRDPVHGTYSCVTS